MTDDFDIFVTADEAWPSFERAVLSAKSSFVAGFRIFDMTTQLRSEEGLAVGETWFDLLAHILRNGVKFSLVVSDFDPVMATELHEIAWKTVRQGAALAELSAVSSNQLKVTAHFHPAKAGLPPTGTGSHRPDGPKADHALTIKLDHSGGADHLN